MKALSSSGGLLGSPFNWVREIARNLVTSTAIPALSLVEALLRKI